MAVGQNQWYHFGVGAPPVLVFFFFCGNWDVHWGYDMAFDPWPYCSLEKLACFPFPSGRPPARDAPTLLLARQMRPTRLGRSDAVSVAASAVRHTVSPGIWVLINIVPQMSMGNFVHFVCVCVGGIFLLDGISGIAQWSCHVIKPPKYLVSLA